MEVSELNLADGEYTVEVTMEGGSGRATHRIISGERTGGSENCLEQFPL